MRKPAVAGRFYPKNKNRLEREIREKSSNIRKNRKEIAKAAISPHAGYSFSGKTAAKSIAALKTAETYIIIGPSHHSKGTGISLSEERWKTPLGQIEVDKRITNQLKGTGIVENEAHEAEHSIEVQLPFLQYFKKDFKIVPIMLSFQDKETIQKLSEKLSKITENQDVSIIASSDFTHYQPQKIAEKQDNEAIDEITNLNLDNFLSLVEKKGYSICGYGPIGTLISIAKKQKLKPKKLEYRTSADSTGDKSQVVGYSSIIFK